MLTPVSPHSFVVFGFLGLLAWAVISDLRSLRIPNRISLAIVCLYPVHVLLSPSPVDWTGALLVAAGVFAVTTVFFAFRWMGGGDVKLFAATGLWMGPQGILGFLFVTALAGGLLALILRKEVRTVLAYAADSLGQKGLRDTFLENAVPYGIAIGIGGAFVAVKTLLA